MLPSFSPGVVPEQEDEGQTAKTHHSLASHSRRPPRGAPDGTGLSFLDIPVPIHHTPSTPSTPPPLSPLGSLLTGVYSSQPLQRTPEATGCAPPLAVPQQTRRVAPNNRRSIPIRRHHASLGLVPLSLLPALGSGTAS